jgi:hypothetical protein
VLAGIGLFLVPDLTDIDRVGQTAQKKHPTRRASMDDQGHIADFAVLRLLAKRHCDFEQGRGP